MNNFFLYISVVLIWGSTWLPMKLQLGVVPVEVSIAYRFMIAATLLFIWCYIKKLPMSFSGKDHFFIALLGLTLFSLNYVFFYSGSAYLTSGLVAIIFSTIVIMNIINSAIIFGNKIEYRVTIGAILGIAGLCIIFWPELSSFSLNSGTSTGLFLCLAGTLFASFGNMVSAHNHKSGIPVVQANTYGMAYGAIAMVIYSIFSGYDFTFDSRFSYIWSLIYLALFGSVLGFGAYLTLLGRIGSQRVAYATVLFPIIALAISTVFEDYALTYRVLFAVLLILFGNTLLLIKGAKQSK